MSKVGATIEQKGDDTVVTFHDSNVMRVLSAFSKIVEDGEHIAIVGQGEYVFEKYKKEEEGIICPPSE